jgi:hypothetical protein
MTPGNGRLLKDNAFLVAAVSLPLIVVIFFVLSSAIPRWIVAPPAYDLLLRATDSYNQTNPRVTVDFEVRDGKVQAIVKGLPASGYGPRSKLFLFNHSSLTASEVPVDLPDDMTEGQPARTIAVDALAGRRILTDAKAPDGYQLQSRGDRGPGIVGEVFGMHRYDSQASLVNKGRVIPITLPVPFQNMYLSAVYAVGWLVDNTPR